MNEEIFSRLKKIAERLKKEYKAERVILFGSYATGDATEESDIDLFIIAPTSERFFQRMATALKLIRDLKKGIPIELIVLTSDEVKERIEIGDQFVEQIIEEGIIL